MTAALLEDLGLDTANWDNDDKGIALAGAIPESKYHARLVHVAERMAGEYTIDELKFEILHGPYAGKLIEEDLFHTGKDAEKTEKAKVRRRTYYHRLGLLEKTEVNGEKKYTLADGKQHLRDCLGNECIIDVKVADEEFEVKKDGVGTGVRRKIKKNKLAYIGVYKLDDPEVKAVPRAKGGSAPPVAKPAASVSNDLSGI